MEQRLRRELFRLPLARASSSMLRRRFEDFMFRVQEELPGSRPYSSDVRDVLMETAIPVALVAEFTDRYELAFADASASYRARGTS